MNKVNSIFGIGLVFIWISAIAHLFTPEWEGWDVSAFLLCFIGFVFVVIGCSKSNVLYRETDKACRVFIEKNNRLNESIEVGKGKVVSTRFNGLARDIHEANKKKGFYDTPREIGTTLMLVVSELTEALDSDQKSKHADVAKFLEETKHLSLDDKEWKETFEMFIKDTFEDEIADALIRLLDLVGWLQIDIDFHIGAKRHYNTLRPYKHGKKY